MPIIVNIGSWIFRGLTAIGAYNVVDAITGNDGTTVTPLDDSNMAKIGLGGILVGYIAYDLLKKDKPRNYRGKDKAYEYYSRKYRRY